MKRLMKASAWLLVLSLCISALFLPVYAAPSEKAEGWLSSRFMFFQPLHPITITGSHKSGCLFVAKA